MTLMMMMMACTTTADPDPADPAALAKGTGDTSVISNWAPRITPGVVPVCLDKSAFYDLLQDATDKDNQPEPLSVETVDGVEVANITPGDHALTHGSYTYDVGGNKVTFTGMSVGDERLPFEVGDGLDIALAHVTFRVTDCNQPPVPEAFAELVCAGTTSAVNMLSHVSDPDGDSVTLVSVKHDDDVLVDQAIPIVVDYGTAGRDGTLLEWTPFSKGKPGPSVFSYTVSDGSAEASAVVTLTRDDACP